ncbi:hypothetical protein [Spongiibacter sp. UBA1325]|uniref:hypothetical protein n=1 Tax=Spongiibacter sp. UBA1325 TaxID=1947543 RepID=UPI00257B8BF6|nr:hypothetical protein [Spongiibacter sp. UBA1325]|tara:strand:- start:7040 stop:7483 length:444 start_codon:yes stop_codon:yes gene_type:complete
MASEAEKGRVEVSIFCRFAKAAGLDYRDVEKQLPEGGKPDIRCRLNEHVTYFELTEACSEDLAKAIAGAGRVDREALARLTDYTSATYLKKIAKRYQVSEPVELLIYNIGRTLLPDKVIIDNLRKLAQRDKGQFRRVWYFGDSVVQL